MSDPVFFRSRQAAPPSLADIVAWSGACVPPGSDLTRAIRAIASLEDAGAGAVTVFDDTAQTTALAATRASACFLQERHVPLAPAGTIPLITDSPRRAFALVAARLLPEALRPGSSFGGVGVNPGASIHPEARLEADVLVDPGVVIGARAEIGAGTIIAANGVVGPDVRIGRGCSIGAQATIAHALVGDRVIVQAGARVGQGASGFAHEPAGPVKLPQIGRVIIQDDAEIGANATIDRGAMRDTVIGEGAKIGNLAVVAADVTVGRHVILEAQAIIPGGCQIGDFAVVGADVRSACAAPRPLIGQEEGEIDG